MKKVKLITLIGLLLAGSVSVCSVLGVQLSANKDSGFIQPPNTTKAIVSTGPITWTGPVDDFGNNMTVSGTSLQDIEAQVQLVHPTFLISSNTTVKAVKTERNPSMDYQVTGLDCKTGGGGYIEVDVIEDGLAYLGSVKGDCQAGPGPAACGRISCSWNGAIWWCNDSPHPFTIKCSDLGYYVQDIIDKCGWFCDACQRGGLWMVRGQEFDAQGFNVLIGYEPLGC